jgi:hypothetical protein
MKVTKFPKLLIRDIDDAAGDGEANSFVSA